ncbi:MAG: SHOCT domain-containing protein [Tepidanaerobacteraceae bacterium]
MNSKIDNTIKYAIQLAMLKKLEAKNLITIAEYKTIKEFLERKYRPNIA